MSSSKPDSRQELIDYALRRLGAPVIEINVDEQQIEDLVDDALQLYKQYHFDGSVKTYRKHQVTQSDFDNEYITIPDTIESVRKVFNIFSTKSASGNMFDIRYQIHLNDIFDLSHAGTISHYYQTKQYINHLEQVVHGHQEFEFSRLQDRMYLPSIRWGKELFVDDYLLIECHEVLDEATYSEIFNDRWLKLYVTSLIKRQWGTNLKKFDNVVLPGGAVLNGQGIFDEAEGEIEKYEQSLRDEYEAPLGFIVG